MRLILVEVLARFQGLVRSICLLRRICECFDHQPDNHRDVVRDGLTHAHFVAAGHYGTEVLGIRALGEHLANRFGLEVEFIDVPNPI